MKKALLKANIIFKESYDFPIISLTSRESIEDFIIKIYDLGFSEKREFPNFLEIGLDKKIEIALELIADCQISKEIILIEDIETRVPKIKENIEEINNDKKERRKEKEDIEYIKWFGRTNY